MDSTLQMGAEGGHKYHVNSECHLAFAGEKPINVVQPQGPSFEVNGNEISWLNWNMRISFNHREGLVFHNVG